MTHLIKINGQLELNNSRLKDKVDTVKKQKEEADLILVESKRRNETLTYKLNQRSEDLKDVPVTACFDDPVPADVSDFVRSLPGVRLLQDTP